LKRLAALVLIAALALPARAQWASGGTTEVPLQGDGNKWVVRATLNGTVDGDFLLDTGASFCVLSPTLARRLGAEATGRYVDLQSANGVVRAPVVELKSIDVGGNRVRGVTAVVHPAVSAGLDGIIGLSYLNNFSYGVDPRRKVLRLR
jgi:clan AA aspartic protease (TIGR02281 family)